MAWVKIPVENHPLFLGALPKDPRLSTIRMFGGLCSLVNGNMAAGLFARSVFVTLDDAGQREALALDGAEPFDPMGTGKAFAGRVMLPETILDEPAELRTWLQRAVDYTATMPPKKKKKQATTSPAKATRNSTAPAKRSAARPTAVGRARAAKPRATARRAKRR